MSRSGYTDDFADDDPLAMGRYRQAVKMATRGRRGQALLRGVLESLDAMPVRKLYAGSFATPEGAFCTLGAHAARVGIKTDDLGDEEDGCDTDAVGERFNIARSLAAEIMYENDEGGAGYDDWKRVQIEVCGPMRRWEQHVRSVTVPDKDSPARRWRRMRAWVAEQLLSQEPSK